MGLAIAFTLFATLAWGAGDVFARKAMFDASAEVVVIVVVAMVTVGLGLRGLATVGASAFGPESLTMLSLTALMGLFSWVTGNLLYFHGMRRAGVTLAAPILGAAPLFAIVLAVALGGERPAVLTLVGALAIVIGVVVIMTDRGRVLR